MTLGDPVELLRPAPAVADGRASRIQASTSVASQPARAPAPRPRGRSSPAAPPPRAPGGPRRRGWWRSPGSGCGAARGPGTAAATTRAGRPRAGRRGPAPAARGRRAPCSWRTARSKIWKRACSGVPPRSAGDREGILVHLQGAEDLDPGPVGRRAPRLPAAPPDHRRPLGRRQLGQVLRQPRLADPRLAGEQDQGALPGRGAPHPGRHPLDGSPRPYSAPTAEPSHETVPQGRSPRSCALTPIESKPGFAGGWPAGG